MHFCCHFLYCTEWPNTWIYLDLGNLLCFIIVNVLSTIDKTIVAKLILLTQNNQKYWEKSKRSCHSHESTVYIVSYLCYTYQYGFSNKMLAYPVANKYNQSKIMINYEYLCLQGLWARERPRLSTTASFAPRAAGHPPPWYFWDSYDLCWCRRNPRAYSCFAHCAL